jgi:hypothetical protein
MTPMSTHSLADARHAERYTHTSPVLARAPRSPLRGVRRHLGMLLVEAGLHLITGADRSRVVSPLAR